MRKLIGLAAGMAVLGLAFTPVLAGGDDCKTCADNAKKGEGFCKDCGHGMIYTVDVASPKVYDALACKTPSKDCAGCKAAGAGNMCPAHTMAAGTMLTDAPKCGDCGKVYRDRGTGFCSACDSGVIGVRAYKTKGTFDHALAALDIIKNAAKTAATCETCAIAIGTNGTCDKCKKTYKGGKPV